MSIVGTRPPLISETNLYEPHHKVRLAIKPGISLDLDAHGVVTTAAEIQDCGSYSSAKK